MNTTTNPIPTQKPAVFKGPWCWGCGAKIETVDAEELANHKGADGKHYCAYECKPKSIEWANRA